MSVAGDAGPDGLIPTVSQYGTALSDIVRCPACGHMQLDELPLEADLVEDYSEAESDDYLEEELGQRATAREVLAEIERFAARARLLDVGCWLGFLLDEARRRGWQATGVEPSTYAATYARETLALDVQVGSLDRAELAEASFGAVVLGDVLEHFPNPADTLDRIARLLTPGGVVCLLVPDAGSRLARTLGRRWWSVLPTHVQYFTRPSIRVLLERRGYIPLLVKTAPKAFTVRYYLGRAEGYSEALGRALVAGAERVGVADRLWAPDFRDRMLVVARAPSG